MRTIIQTIGPLYGEIVNGSVFGQPNGSEAIPAGPYIELYDTNPTYAYIKNYTNSGTTVIAFTDNAGQTVDVYSKYLPVTQAQTDIKMWLQLRNSSGTILGQVRDYKYNDAQGNSFWGLQIINLPSVTIDTGELYTVRILLCAGSAASPSDPGAILAFKDVVVTGVSV